MAGARASVVAVCLITFGVVGWLALVTAEDRLKVQTPGRFGSQPQDWWVRVWLTPAEEDRVLRIIADGPMYRSSDIALVGLKSAKVHQLWFRALSAGCYEFVAQVHARDGDGPVIARAFAPMPLSVSGPGTSGDVCGGPPP
jgi:hypothetical protein